MHGAEIDHLVRALGKLPGLGPRSARRAVLALIQRREALMAPLVDALDRVAREIKVCSICGNVDTTDPCGVCADPRRDPGTLCVVEGVGDLWALDRGQSFDGRYHVLGGVLSALDGIGPEQLNVAGLLRRVETGTLTEVVLALNATVDGQTTAHYLAERLKPFDVTVTRLAHGVPVGGELDYLDDGTLGAAMRARRPL